ncbi:hypothetical protein MUP06_00800 [Patescibacteria group bacterium]|nr:hypothetical protein [Patescibacteria group bacterium]
MAIEIIPKKTEAKLPAVNILFYLSLILLIIFALSYFVLGYFQKKSAKTLQDIEDIISQKETSAKALKEKIFGYQEKIEVVASLLTSHQLSRNFFTRLEDLSCPKVFFSNLDLDVGKSQVSLSGQTESFEALGQQLLIFKKGEFIKDVNLTKVSIGKEGEIEFTIELSFDPQIFK